MRSIVRPAAVALAASLGALAPDPARATEAAAGHYIAGALAGPGAGIVPPEPGVYATVPALLFYRGSLSATRQIPIGGRLETGLTADFALATVGAAYVPPVSMGQFTPGFAAALPFGYVRGRAALVGPRGREVDRTDDVFALGDMTFSPMLGWRDHTNSHFAMVRLDVTAPTGEYDQRRLASVGMNYWTFTPVVGYTYLNTRLGLDVSALAGIDINTRNAKTDYQSGALLHLDVSVAKSVGGGVSLGVLGGMLYQVSDDTGALARRLNGFRGQSFTVGPLATYDFRLGRTQLKAMLAWAPEFAVRNRTQGNTVIFRLAASF